MDFLVVAGVFLAGAVSRKVEDKVLDLAWDKVKPSLQKMLGRNVEPADATPARIRALAELDPQVRDALHYLGTESSVLRRIASNGDALEGARILWVDDSPQNNELEVRTLECLGASVVVAENTGEAVADLRDSGADLVISDIARPERPRAGLEDLSLLKTAAGPIAIIFYIGRTAKAGVPEGAFGITTRPDELLHLCLDALERTRR